MALIQNFHQKIREGYTAAERRKAGRLMDRRVLDGARQTTPLRLAALRSLIGSKDGLRPFGGSPHRERRTENSGGTPLAKRMDHGRSNISIVKEDDTRERRQSRAGTPGRTNRQANHQAIRGPCRRRRRRSTLP